jgi:hypothetical protein
MILVESGSVANEIKPATLVDIESFYGRRPDRTVKAFSVYRDGELVAIAGVTLERERIVAFSDIKEGVTAPKITIWRTAKETVKHIAKLNLPAIAITGSGKFLESLGFKYVGECDEGTIYRL